MQSIQNRIAVILRDSPFPDSDGLQDEEHTREVTTAVIDVALKHLGVRFTGSRQQTWKMDGVFGDVDVLVHNALVYAERFSKRLQAADLEGFADDIYQKVQAAWGRLGKQGVS